MATSFFESWGHKVKTVMSTKNVARKGDPSLTDEYTSRSVRFPLIMDELQYLLGQVLTVIDASIHDPRQNKATKDLIKQHFGRTIHDTFWHYCFANEFDPNVELYYSQNIVPGTIKISDEKFAPKPPRGVDFPEVE